MTVTAPPLFDKLRYLDKLTSAGIAEDQARAHADAMDDALREAVATKADVVSVRTDIATLRNEMAAMEHRLTVRTGLTAAAAVGILASLKFFG